MEFECPEPIRCVIERRMAFYDRTWDEELNYTLEVMYELRKPDPQDTDSIRRFEYLQKRGELPRQLLAKVEARLASIDLPPHGTIIPRPTTVREVFWVYMHYKVKGQRSKRCLRQIIGSVINGSVLADWPPSTLTPQIVTLACKYGGSSGNSE
jgi:hypothetical protein